MFYSEALLSKTGPLARVWLSANMERKISKTDILKQNIESSVSAIVDQGQAPMALRLSGQLLLGVVRIYSRKARYLMDDCNEALLKIKTAFRPGNLDLLPVTDNIANPNLTLPDTLADVLPFPLIDESIFDVQPMDLDLGERHDRDPLNWTSQLYPDPSNIRGDEDQPMLYEDDLGLDFGADEPSIEAGRNVPTTRPIGEDIMSDDHKLYDDDLGLNFGDDEPTHIEEAPQDPAMPDIENPENFDYNLEDTSFAPDVSRPPRGTDSPLSSPRSNADLNRSREGSVVVARQPAAKRRRLLPVDNETTLDTQVIKAQQADRSAILKPVSYLPSDPVLLTLMEMQKNGTFVSSIMGDDQYKGWAPELRGILSIDLVRRSTTKRKRDSGIAEEDEEQHLASADEIPPQDEGIALGDDTSHLDKFLQVARDDDEGFMPVIDDDEDQHGAGRDTFDDTTVPLVHPEDSGPVSLGTQHAVHLLRDRFGGREASSQKQSVFFNDLLPESSTTKAEATKMFFEVLVLATKDAIKVEQAENELGGAIRIRGKRGLWGTWAEKEAGGEIEKQDGEHELAHAGGLDVAVAA